VSLIIELAKPDAYRLLWLVQILADTDQGWFSIAEQIKKCLDAQAGGNFFQCSACTDKIEQPTPKENGG
jgi:hypothetical protein